MNKIDIHKDYIMFCLMSQLTHQLHLICAYMQNTTPYGKEYQDAYRYIDNLESHLDTLSEKLQCCVERKEKN